MVGGDGDLESGYLSSIELFPRPPSDTCFIPDLPQRRNEHSLSLLSGGRLVVCGGWYGIRSYGYIYLDSCISWVAGNTSWTHFCTMRCLPMIMDKPSSDCYLDLFLILYSVFVKLNKDINPTPRNALSVGPSRFLPPSNAHAHQSDL